jgi:hypothetical protein
MQERKEDSVRKGAAGRQEMIAGAVSFQGLLKPIIQFLL